MSTFTDGVRPSVNPGPDDPSGPDLGEDGRRNAVRSDHDPVHPLASDVPHSRAAAADRNLADQPDWLSAEIQRRIAGKAEGGARHARRGVAPASSSVAYTPRPTVRTGPEDLAPGPAAPAEFPPANGQSTGPHVAGPEVVGPDVDPHHWSPRPPEGSAARLLSPRHTPPATPTGIPIDTQDRSRTTSTGSAPVQAPADVNSPTTPVLARVGPPPTASPELEASGKVIWTSVTPPLTAPVPVQRDADPAAVVAPVVAAPAVAAPAVPPRPVPEPLVDELPADSPDSIKRVRVVLAERRAATRAVRTVVDVQEGTGVGELLRSNLIFSQLTVALMFAGGAVLTLGMLPLVFAFFPEIDQLSVFGIRLPWLLLGFLVYPFLLGLGWWHTHTAERVEQNFADHVQD